MMDIVVTMNIQEKLWCRKKENLKARSKYGVGLDKIDVNAAKEFGIKVTNVPELIRYCFRTRSCIIIYILKNILQFNSVQKGSWERDIGFEIQGKKLV